MRDVIDRALNTDVEPSDDDAVRAYALGDRFELATTAIDGAWLLSDSPVDVEAHR